MVGEIVMRSSTNRSDGVDGAQQITDRSPRTKHEEWEERSAVTVDIAGYSSFCAP